MWSYLDLLAGESSTGRDDGEFNKATFNHPSGLTMDPSSRKIYVADRDNHCIRVVELDENNRVSTLVGTTQSGYLDGPFDRARFRSPTSLVFIGPGLLAVNDQGNSRIRLVDLPNRAVTTLAGSDAGGLSEGPAQKCSLSAIWSMDFQGSQDCLFFSEPALGSVQKLDLKTNTITTVLHDRPEIPNPEALCVWQEGLYVADRNLPGVYHCRQTKDGTALEPIGQGKAILSLVGSKKGLYALQNDPSAPFEQLKPYNRKVQWVSAWGDPLPTVADSVPCFDGLGPESNLQLISDPFSPDRFYIPSPQWQSLFSFHDVFQDDLIAAGPEMPLASGLTDWDYPADKPPHIFRILVIGDSHVYHTFPDDQKKKGWNHENLMGGLTKRLELELNTLASLDDNPIHFQVLTLAQPGTHPLFLWPYYLAPDVVQKYDVDLVLYLFSPNMFTPDMFDGRTTNSTDFSFQDYFIRPLSSEGIPEKDLDPEILLKPIADKMPGNLAGHFFELCRSKNLARSDEKSKELWFADFNRLVAEPDIEKDLVQLIGRPIRMLHDKIDPMRTHKGQPVALRLGILPVGQFFPMKAQMPFWNDLGDYTHVPLLDLSKDFTALRPAWYPLSDHKEYDHFSSDGYFVEALVLAHKLIQERVVPWPSQ